MSFTYPLVGQKYFFLFPFVLFFVTNKTVKKEKGKSKTNKQEEEEEKIIIISILQF